MAILRIVGLDGSIIEVPAIKGDKGSSAYEVALETGFEGTEQEWLNSLKGASGKDGNPGENGSNGKDGTSITITSIETNEASGATNKVEFSDGTILSVKNGIAGSDGISPSIELIKNDQISTLTITDAFGVHQTEIKDGAVVQIDSKQETDEPGETNIYTFTDGTILRIKNGKDGKTLQVESEEETTEDSGINIYTLTDGSKMYIRNGSKGSDGKSAYEIVVDNGLFDGTEEEWAENLVSNNSEEIEKLTNNINFHKLVADADIEIGTWTPTVQGMKELLNYDCRYMRINNICYLTFMIDGTGLSSNDKTTSERLGFYGIPYKPSSLGYPYYGGGGHMQDEAGGNPRLFSGYILSTENHGIFARTNNPDLEKGSYYFATDSGAVTMCGSIIYPIDESDLIHSISNKGYNESILENTIPAFIAAKEKGYNYMLADVAFAYDNTPVLATDNVADDIGVSDLTYLQILKNNIGTFNDAPIKIASLKEFLNLSKNLEFKCYLNLTKEYTEEQLQSLIDTVKQCGFSHNTISFISNHLSNLQTISSLTGTKGGCRLGYVIPQNESLVSSEITSVKNLITNYKKAFIIMSCDNLDIDTISNCKTAGIPLEFYDVLTADEYINYIDKYVKGVITDNLVLELELQNNKYSYIPPETPGENEIYKFVSSDFASRKVSTSNPYYSSSTTNLLIQGTNIKIAPGTTIKVDIDASVDVQYSCYCITNSGATRIKNGSSISSSSYYQNDGWMENHGTYTIPEDTAYVWFNIHETSDATITQDQLNSAIISIV